MSEPEQLQLTDGEAVVTIVAVVAGSLTYAGTIQAARARGEEPAAADWTSLWELQSVAKKLQRLLQMPDPLFFELLARAIGEPDPQIVPLLIEAQVRAGGRKPVDEGVDG